MSILKGLIDESKKDNLDLDTELKMICDTISEEEKNDSQDVPTGPNIYLAIEVPGITKRDLCFVCLERESRGKFIASLWSKQRDKDTPIKRTVVWEIKEDRAERILGFFADKVAFMRGE